MTASQPIDRKVRTVQLAGVNDYHHRRSGRLCVSLQDGIFMRHDLAVVCDLVGGVAPCGRARAAAKFGEPWARGLEAALTATQAVPLGCYDPPPMYVPPSEQDEKLRRSQRTLSMFLS